MTAFIPDDEVLDAAIADLRVAFPETVETRTDRPGEVLLRFRVRGIPVQMHVFGYPDAVPAVAVDKAVAHTHVRGRDVVGLASLADWNRTLSLKQVALELERAFRDTPPIDAARASAWLRWLRGVFGGG